MARDKGRGWGQQGIGVRTESRLLRVEGAMRVRVRKKWKTWEGRNRRRDTQIDEKAAVRQVHQQKEAIYMYKHIYRHPNRMRLQRCERGGEKGQEGREGEREG
jgi:hypothetical protein